MFELVSCVKVYIPNLICIVNTDFVYELQQLGNVLRVDVQSNVCIVAAKVCIDIRLVCTINVCIVLNIFVFEDFDCAFPLSEELSQKRYVVQVDFNIFHVDVTLNLNRHNDFFNLYGSCSSCTFIGYGNGCLTCLCSGDNAVCIGQFVGYNDGSVCGNISSGAIGVESGYSNISGFANSQSICIYFNFDTFQGYRNIFNNYGSCSSCAFIGCGNGCLACLCSGDNTVCIGELFGYCNICTTGNISGGAIGVGSSYGDISGFANKQSIVIYCNFDAGQSYGNFFNQY